jgi:clan AA aspartic protease (TIGR02281 family)
MHPMHKIVLSRIWALVTFVSVSAWAGPVPPDILAQEARRAENDLATGGVGKLGASWYACVDEARASQNANTAERCIIYGYGASRLAEADPIGGESPRMRVVVQDMVDQGLSEMLDIMGIPAGARQAWLERYRRAIGENQPTRTDAADIGRASLPPVIRDTGPVFNPPPAGHPRSAGDNNGHDALTNLARAADGKYPTEALRDPAIADALRRLVGPALFPRLKDYSFGTPMEYNGRHTVGHACEPGACGVSEARFVFSADEVWLGVVDGRRMRLYGNPPRPIRALLMRDRNQVAWRGAIEDMGRSAPPTIVPVAAESPRMTISPHVSPVVADPGTRVRPDAEATEIPLRRAHGSLLVPVMINNTLTVPFTVDSGASDVSISADVMRKLMESGTLTRSDFQGRATYHLADGSHTTSETFRLHSLRVGDREVHDVLASVTDDADGLLLGQSFLTRFRSWSIDNQRQVLLLK